MFKKGTHVAVDCEKKFGYLTKGQRGVVSRDVTDEDTMAFVKVQDKENVDVWTDKKVRVHLMCPSSKHGVVVGPKMAWLGPPRPELNFDFATTLIMRGVREDSTRQQVPSKLRSGYLIACKMGSSAEEFLFMVVGFNRVAEKEWKVICIIDAERLNALEGSADQKQTRQEFLRRLFTREKMQFYSDFRSFGWQLRKLQGDSENTMTGISSFTKEKAEEVFLWARRHDVNLKSLTAREVKKYCKNRSVCLPDGSHLESTTVTPNPKKIIRNAPNTSPLPNVSSSPRPNLNVTPPSSPPIPTVTPTQSPPLDPPCLPTSPSSSSPSPDLNLPLVSSPDAPLASVSSDPRPSASTQSPLSDPPPYSPTHLHSLPPESPVLDPPCPPARPHSPPPKSPPLDPQPPSSSQLESDPTPPRSTKSSLFESPPPPELHEDYADLLFENRRLKKELQQAKSKIRSLETEVQTLREQTKHDEKMIEDLQLQLHKGADSEKSKKGTETKTSKRKRRSATVSGNSDSESLSSSSSDVSRPRNAYNTRKKQRTESESQKVRLSRQELETLQKILQMSKGNYGE